MHLFFQIQIHQVLILCMDDYELAFKLYCVLLCFSYNVIKFNHFWYFFIILLHLISSFLNSRSSSFLYAYVFAEFVDYMGLHLVSSVLSNVSLLVPYAYFFIELIVCFLFSWLALNSVFWNLCCDFNTNLFIFISYSWFPLKFSTSMSFIF